VRGITRGRVGHASRRSLSAVVGFAVAAAIAATLSVAAPSLAASSAAAHKCGGTGSTTTVTGKFADGATYLMQCPAGKWNGTLLLYSHGYVVPGASNPAEDVSDLITASWMLSNGFAMAGSSYAATGWAVQQALPDQVNTLAAFKAQFGKPRQTIAWGDSLGGLITFGLVQDYPKLFTAALPMCGVGSGGVATWNTALDAELVFQQLVPGGEGLQLVNITNPTANLQLAEKLIVAAQKTKAGRARLALGAALADTPGWFTPQSKQPAPTDWLAKEDNQYEWFTQIDLPFVFDFRANLEADAGGNPSWTTGVNFTRQLHLSVDYHEVVALYKKAGLNLSADLQKLAKAPRISPDAKAVAYLEKNISFNGHISIPVLSVHTTGDGLVVPENEQAYRSVVDKAGNGALLRQIFVHRAGHCAFSPADTITSLKVLLSRVKSGEWDAKALTTASLNASAKALGPGYNIFTAQNGKCPVGKPVFGTCPAPPAFTNYKPQPYLRPFDLGDPVPDSHQG
jgi:pimeloyl-ACP methyl ester carboxylesterase